MKASFLAESLLLACLSTGCVSLHATWPVEVTVIDRETNQPVPNLPVASQVMYFMTFNAPSSYRTKTDDDGKAILPLSSSWLCPSYLSVGARVDGDGHQCGVPLTTIVQPQKMATKYYEVGTRPTSWWKYLRHGRATKLDW